MPTKKETDALDFDTEASAEELTSQVQRAQSELAELKRRAEQIERDKQRLEELSRRQDELETNRADLIDKFTRSLALAQRETEGTQKRLEQLHAIHNTFLDHMRTLEAIDPKDWVGGDLSRELSKAMSSVDTARADYLKAAAKLESEQPEVAHVAAAGEYDEYYGGAERGFTYWIGVGFAFTLPLIAALFVLALIFWLAAAGAR